MNVEYVLHSGDDLLVVNAARVSLGKHKEAFDESDEKLLKYLLVHEHRSPFYHPHLTLRLTIPIFVARQLMRHTVGFAYNEISGRYVEFEEQFYSPSEWRKAGESIKQGSSDEVLENQEHFKASAIYNTAVNTAYNTYKHLLSLGVAKELARIVLPVNTYTQMYVTGSLWAWLWFLKLRLDSHAQREIQDVARQVEAILKTCYPVSTKLFMETMQ